MSLLAHEKCQNIIDEMLEILAEIIEEPILNEIKSSQAINLEVSESTDVSMSRQLDLHVRYGNIYFVCPVNNK